MLKRCEQYYSLISTALPAEPLPVAPKPTWTAKPMVEPMKPVWEQAKPAWEPTVGKPVWESGAKPLGEPIPEAKPIAPEAVKAPSITPTATEVKPIQDFPYKIEFEKWNKRVEPPKTKIGPDKTLKVYVDETGKIFENALPDELKTDSTILRGKNSKVPKDVLKHIEQSVKTEMRANIKTSWNDGGILGKATAISDFAKLNNFKLYAKGAAALIMIGGVLYLLSGKTPSAKSAVGKKLQQEAIASVSGIDGTKIIKNTDLQDKLKTISALAESYASKTSNATNKTTLSNIASQLGVLNNALSLKDFTIDDGASAQDAATNLSSINNSIKTISNNKYLERFASFLTKRNDTANAALVTGCEVDLANYSKLITDSGHVAKSMKTSDSSAPKPATNEEAI
jgi:hypothetical protein